MKKSALISELQRACEMSAGYEGGYSGEFLDAKEFSVALKKTVKLLESGNDAVVKDLWLWFAPTTAWDDFIGDEGVDLGNSIFEKLEQYIRENEIKI